MLCGRLSPPFAVTVVGWTLVTPMTEVALCFGDGQRGFSFDKAYVDHNDNGKDSWYGRWIKALNVGPKRGNIAI